MAKDLRKVYQSQFEAMYIDALENQREASEALKASEQELVNARQNLADLKSTAKECKGKFANDAKELIKFGFGKEVILETLKQIAENIMLFVSSKETIPEAEAEIREKEQIYGMTGERFRASVSDVMAIESFISDKKRD